MECDKQSHIEPKPLSEGQGRFDGVVDLIQGVTKSKMAPLLLVLMSGSLDGCAIKMHKVETDMGVIDQHKEMKYEDAGVAVKSASTDGTALSITADMLHQCTDQRFDTHLMRSHLVTDEHRLPRMAVSSLVFSTIALTGVGLAVNAQESYNSGAATQSEAQGMMTGGVLMAVGAGIPAFFYDTSLIRTGFRMAEHTDKEKDVLGWTGKPYSCHPTSFDGRANMAIKNSAGATEVSRQAEFTRGTFVMPSSDIPLSYWADPNWQFKLYTSGWEGPNVNVNRIKVSGETAVALRHAKEAYEARMAEEAKAAAEEARVAAEQERALAQQAKEEAAAAERVARLRRNVTISISSWYQKCWDEHYQVYNTRPERDNFLNNDITSYSTTAEDRSIGKCEQYVPVTITLRNNNALSVNVSAALRYNYSRFLYCSAERQNITPSVVPPKRSVRVKMNIDTYQPGMFYSGNCQLIGVGVDSMDVAPAE